MKFTVFIFLIVLCSFIVSCNDNVSGPNDSITPANNLRLSSLSANSIKISWRNTTKNLSKIEVWRGQDDNSLSTIASLTKNDTTFFDDELDPSNRYFYVIKSFSSDNDKSVFSNMISIEYTHPVIVDTIFTEHWLNDAIFSRDGKLLATGDRDGAVTIYSFPKMELKYKLKESFPDQVEVVDFSYDDNYIAGASNGEIYVWDVANGNHFKTFKWGDINSFDCSPIAPYFVAENYSNFQVINYLTGDIIFKSNYYGTVMDITALNFSPDGSMLAVAFDNEIRIFETTNWTIIKIILSPFGSAPFKTIHTLYFSNNSSTIGAVYLGKELMIYDVASGISVASRVVSGYDIKSFSFDPKNNSILIGEYYKLILWSIQNQQVIQEIYQDIGDLINVKYSPNGEYMVTHGIADRIYVYGYGWQITD